MLTRRGVGLLTSAVIAWAAGRILGVGELYMAAIAAVALVGLSGLLVLARPPSVQVRRHVPPRRLNWGQHGDVTLEVRNSGRLGAGLLLVEDTCPPALAPPRRFAVAGLPRGHTTVLRYRISGTARGRFELGPVVVRTRDAFGLVQRVRHQRSTDQVIVHPRMEPLGQAPGRGAHRGNGSSTVSRLLNQGDEFYTMREYTSGDDLRMVHWPSTAHRQKLMVRQQEQPWEAQATIFCDTRTVGHAAAGGPASLETAVSAAASVLWHLAARGYQLRLMTDADLRPPAPVTSWPSLLDELAEISASNLRDLARSLRVLRAAPHAEGLLVAVVCPPPFAAVKEAADVRALVQAGRAFAARSALILAPGPDRAAGRRDRDDASDSLRELLESSGWRASVLPSGTSVADAWEALPARLPRVRTR